MAAVAQLDPQNLLGRAVGAEAELEEKKQLEQTTEEKQYYGTCKMYRAQTGLPFVDISNLKWDGSADGCDEKKSGKNDKDNEPFRSYLALNQDIKTFDAAIFLDNYCKVMKLRRSQVKIVSMQLGSIYVEIEHVHGAAIKSVASGYTDKKKLKTLSQELKVFAIAMGEPKALEHLPKLKIRDHVKFLHGSSKKYGRGGMEWKGSLPDGRNRGGRPYYCPVGWKKYAIEVRGMDSGKFSKNYDGWPIAYHGTKFDYALSILLSGFCAAEVDVHGAGLYLSPSIIYCAHERYAEPKEIDFEKHKKTLIIDNSNGAMKGKRFVQCVLQVRVNPKALRRGKIDRETLGIGDNTTIDPNFSNKEIEWLIKTPKRGFWDFSSAKSDVVCAGLMIRIMDKHPKYLKESKWWRNNVSDKERNAEYLF